MTQTRTAQTAQLIAQVVDAYHRCVKLGNPFAEKHLDTLRAIERNILPSGNGIDSGTRIDVARSTANKLTLTTSFHHMNDGGYYDGWTEHTVTVRPSLAHGLDIRISGRDRNGIKEYLHDVFQHGLSGRIEMTWTGNGLDTETTYRLIA